MAPCPVIRFIGMVGRFGGSFVDGVRGGSPAATAAGRGGSA
jgi:hypothetical protein